LNKVVVLGALLVVAGVALVAYGAAGQGNASAGGFILIGPFPIVFGTGSNGGELALLSVLLGVLMVVLLLVMALRAWRTQPAR
jgi:uncharacterized membrane protein